MYKVILIDDEKWVLVDLLHTFPWEKYGFTVAGQTTSPAQALELAQRTQPDVALLDVRMPTLNGLELIGLLKQQSPRLTFVILSGYSEFSYAHDAIRLGVFDYCLKPMDEEQAETLLARLRDHLDRLPPAPLCLPRYRCGNAQFNQLMDYVRQHLFEKLSLEELAGRFYLNANYCGQLFKSLTGKTFSQFIRDARLHMAEELLLHTRLPVTEVACRVGYEDLHYFTRIFTQAYGLSPRAYRKQGGKL